MSVSAPDNSPCATKTPTPAAALKCLDWLNWPRIALLSFLGAFLVGIYVYTLVPVNYSAEVSFLFNEQPDAVTSLLALPQSGGGAGGLVGMVSSAAPAQRYEQLIKSRALRRQLVTRYGLAKRYGTSDRRAENLLKSSIGIKTLGRTGGLTGSGAVGMAVSVTFPAGPRLNTWLGRPVVFQPAEAKELSARVANDAVAFLDSYSTESSITQARATRLFVEKRRAVVEQELSRTQQQLITLQKQYRLLTPESKTELLTGELTRLTDARKATEVQVRDLSASLKAVRSRLPAETRMRVASEVTSRNPMIVKLDGELLDLQTRLDNLKASGALDGHPDVVEVEKAISAKQAQLRSLTAEVRDGVTRSINPLHDSLASKLVDQEVQLAGARGREQTLSRQLAASEREVLNLPPVAQEYTRLSRQAQVQAELLATLVKRLEVARIEEERENSGRFQLLDAAEPPLHKSGPSTVKTTLMAFVALFVVLSLAHAYRLGWISLEEPDPER